MKTRKSEQGMSLVELVVALAVLAVVLTGAISTYMMCAQTNDGSHARSLVLDDLRRKSEEIQARLASDAADLDDVIDWYSINNFFTIPEDASSVDQVEAQGEVILYLDETNVPLELGADAGLAFQAMVGSFGPRTLDGNSLADTDYSLPDADGNYGVNVLPVEIRATWRTSQGNMMMRRFLLLARDY